MVFYLLYSFDCCKKKLEESCNLLTFTGKDKMLNMFEKINKTLKVVVNQWNCQLTATKKF